MKKLKYLFLVMISITLFSCANSESIKHVFYHEFEQNAEILRFKTTDKEYKTLSGSFFLGCGSIKSDEGSIKINTFYVVNKKGEQVLLKAYPEKIKYVLDEKSKTPTVKFVYGSNFPYHTTDGGTFIAPIFNYYSDCKRINEALTNNWYDMYVVITCNPNLFPSDYDFLTYK